MNSDAVYDVILTVRGKSGIAAKQQVLRKLDYSVSFSVQEVIRYCMHPHWHYGVTVSPSRAGAGNDTWSDDTCAMLEAMRDGVLTGYSAKRALHKEIEHLTYRSAMLLIETINKNFRFGLGPKSINDVFPGLIPVHAIQLAKPIDYARVKYPVLVSPKLDGLRAIYKDGKLYSRLGNEFKGLTQIEAWLHEYMPLDVQLDGELMVEGEHFNEISGQLRSFRETDKAVFNVFDIPNCEGSQIDRYTRLSSLLARKQNNVQLVEHVIAHDDDDIQDLYQDALSNGYEGIMVKNMYAQYENARTWSWMKVKPTHTEDLKVVGTFEGHGKYEGLLGGLIVDRGGVRVRVGSGLSDAQRAIWADDCSDILGATIEVAFQEVTPDGSLRHPRLKSVRGDK